ncbi:hypothetical protein [Methanospirillum lacunae]|uniref:Uncharacterized protein n=1 Tax=Methanospirillum lacunae TaxID=668570 RepID=A0A2V2N0H9_9EURY|nr:hypothetical protein [Methanospirillum lacunae]PWR73864.1 hypothetical protein DK846_01460 [Methanospirillum lacunae]
MFWLGKNHVWNSRRGGAIIPRNTDKFTFEIKAAIEAIQIKEKTIIPRNVIEEEISSHPEKYLNLGKMHDIPLKMVITAVENRIPGTEVYRQRPASGLSHIVDLVRLRMDKKKL